MQIQTYTIKAQSSDLSISIFWSDLANWYFRRHGSWLYQKLDGTDGNQKPISFTDEEHEQLRGALVDLSERIRKAADRMQYKQ